jgi:dUTP pyrophosphatase
MDKFGSQIKINVETEYGPIMAQLIEKLDAYNRGKAPAILIELSFDAKMPVRSTSGAAAWDIHACLDEPRTVQPGSRITIPTGVSVALPAGFYWDMRARSGLAFKHGLMLINGAGVIDEDYRGITQVQYFNAGEKPYTFHNGERIAQVILTRYFDQEFEEVDELPDTDRGTGGFGHTGK